MGRFWTGLACAALLLPLAACGGGGGSSTPPISLNGVSYDRFVAQPQLRQTRGGDGGATGDVLYVEDGDVRFLGTRSASSGGTTEFRATDGSVALVTALPNFESLRRIRLVTNGGQAATEGIIGRFTSDARMAQASGTATYIGSSTAEIRGESVFGSRFELDDGDTRVVVDFTGRTVSTTLDFTRTPLPGNTPIDTVRIDGMQISGNRFSGGTLTATKGGTVDPGFTASGSSLNSSGVFAGWNDSTGAVRDRNLPAEVGGAFVATPGFRTLVGRYMAD